MSTNLPPPNLFVCVAESTAWIKIVGRATFTTSVTFKNLGVELLNRGLKRFKLDLRECATMDSTYLGVVVGLALTLAEDSEAEQIRLVNPSQRIVDLMENLGVADLFVVENLDPSAIPAPESVRATPSVSREDISRAVLEAHQTLMDVNPENVPRFQDVARFLTAELKGPVESPPSGDESGALEGGAEGPNPKAE